MSARKLQLIISASVSSLVGALEQGKHVIASVAPRIETMTKAFSSVATLGASALGSITSLTSGMMRLQDGAAGVGQGVARFGEALKNVAREAKDLQRHQPAMDFLNRHGQGGQAGGVNPLVAGAAGGLTARMGAMSPGTLGVVAATGSLLAGMGEVVEVGAEFERAMSRVLALTSASASEFAALRQQALALGKGAFGPTEIATSMGNFAQAGLEVKEIMSAIKPSLDAASAGEMGLSETVTMASGVIRAFGLDASRTQEAMDVLVMAANKSNASVQDFSDAMKFVGPIARASGKSVQEVAATLMALADVGIRGEMGGTTLRNILMKVTNPTAEARMLLKTLGLSFQDAAGDALHLGKIVDQTKSKISGFGKGQRLEILGEIGEARAATGLAALMEQGGDLIRKNQEMLQQATGASEQIASIKLDNVVGSWTMFRKSVDALGISLFELAKGPLRSAIDLLTSAMEKLDGLLSGIGDALERLGPTGRGVKGAASGAIGGGGVGALAGGVLGGLVGIFGGPGGIIAGAKTGAMLGAKAGALYGGVTEGVKGVMSAPKPAPDKNAIRVGVAAKEMAAALAKGKDSLTSVESIAERHNLSGRELSEVMGEARKQVASLGGAAKGLEGSTRAIDVKKLTDLHQGLTDLGKAMQEQLTSVRELTAATMELNAMRKGDAGFITRQLSELPSRSELFGDTAGVRQHIESKMRELRGVEQAGVRTEAVKLDLKVLGNLKDIGGVKPFILPKTPEGRGQFDENPRELRRIMEGIPNQSREEWFKRSAEMIEKLPEKMNRVESIEQVRKAMESYSGDRAAVADIHKRIDTLLTDFPREAELLKGVMTTEQPVPRGVPPALAPEAALLGVIQEQVSALQERQRLREIDVKVPPLFTGIAPQVALDMETQRLHNLTEALDEVKKKALTFKPIKGDDALSQIQRGYNKALQEAIAEFQKQRGLVGQLKALDQVGDTSSKVADLKTQLDKLGVAEGGLTTAKNRIDALERVRKASEEVIRIEKQINQVAPGIDGIDTSGAMRDLIRLRDELRALEGQRVKLFADVQLRGVVEAGQSLRDFLALSEKSARLRVELSGGGKTVEELNRIRGELQKVEAERLKLLSGTALVKLSTDMAPLRQLLSVEKEMMTLTVRLDGLTEARRQLDDLSRQRVEIEARVKAGVPASDADKLKRELEDIGRRRVELEARLRGPDLSALHEQLATLERRRVTLSASADLKGLSEFFRLSDQIDDLRLKVVVEKDAASLAGLQKQLVGLEEQKRKLLETPGLVKLAGVVDFKGLTDAQSALSSFLDVTKRAGELRTQLHVSTEAKKPIEELTRLRAELAKLDAERTRLASGAGLVKFAVDFAPVRQLLDLEKQIGDVTIRIGVVGPGVELDKLRGELKALEGKRVTLLASVEFRKALDSKSSASALTEMLFVTEQTARLRVELLGSGKTKKELDTLRERFAELEAQRAKLAGSETLLKLSADIAPLKQLLDVEKQLGGLTLKVGLVEPGAELTKLQEQMKALEVQRVTLTAGVEVKGLAEAQSSLSSFLDMAKRAGELRTQLLVGIETKKPIEELNRIRQELLKVEQQKSELAKSPTLFKLSADMKPLKDLLDAEDKVTRLTIETRVVGNTGKIASDLQEQLSKARAIRDVLFLREAERLELQKSLPIFQQIQAKQEELQRQVKAGAKDSALEGIRKDLAELQRQAPGLLNAELMRRQVEDIGKVWASTRTPLEQFNAEMTRLDSLLKVPEALTTRMAELKDQLTRAMELRDFASMDRIRGELEGVSRQVRNSTLSLDDYGRAAEQARKRLTSLAKLPALYEEGTSAAASFVNRTNFELEVERSVSVGWSGMKEGKDGDTRTDTIASESRELLKEATRLLKAINDEQKKRPTTKDQPLLKPQ